MAIRYWDGDTNTDWATAANWSGDTLPAADDEVIFDGRQVTKPTTGMSDGAANNSGVVGQCTFDLLHFESSYTGGIGTAALPLCCAPDKVIIDGTGTYYLNCAKTDQSTDCDVDLLIINNASAVVYLYSNCNDGANLAEWTRVMLLAGELHVAFYSADTDDQGAYVKDLVISPRFGAAGSATCYIEKDAYDVLNSVASNIYVANGTLATDSQVGTFEMYNGTVYYGSEKLTTTAVTEADMDIAELRQHGGTFWWLPDDSGTPTITTAHILGGTFDASDSTSNDRAKTITTMYGCAGATVNLDNGRGNITVTNYNDFGAALTVDTGSKLAISYDTP